MIRSIKHKGLKKLFEENDPAGVAPAHKEKLILLLSVLDAAESLNVSCSFLACIR